MCLWKLLLLGWNRTGPDSDAAPGKRVRRNPSGDDDWDDDDDDRLSDSGISSGEFSLENVCEHACGPVAPRPPPAPDHSEPQDRSPRFLKIHGIRNLNQKSTVGYTALHEASINGHVACVEWLIRYSGCKSIERDAEGCNVLHLASKYGRVNVVRWLLWEADMPVLERSNNGALALHYASARGCLDCVKLLCKSAGEIW